jgi:uroporphyrin-3 C-methyltransferase
MHIDNDPPPPAGMLPRSEALEPPAPPPSVAPATGRGWALRIALAALLLVIAGIAAGYLAWRQLDARQQAQAGRAQELRTALDATRERQEELTGRLARMEDALPGVTQQMGEVEELLRRAAVQRVEPADVERLLRMASDSLQLEGDSATALTALRKADQRLQALGDPLFAEVRRRLAQEITALEAVPQPDIAGMAYILNSLQGELGSLLLKHEAPVRPGAGQAEDAGRAALPRWRLFLHDMWAAFKGLVVVRHRAGTEPPLITPDEQVFLTQSLRLELESARLALLGRDDRNFHASLATVRAWLRDYYDAGSAAVTAVDARLAEMDRVDIAPPLPDISASLHALQAALERGRGMARERDARPPSAARVPERPGGHP